MFLKKIRRYAALATGDFEKIFKNFKVPSLPQVVNKILELLQQPEVSFEEVARYIEYDPGLTSQLLKVVNSPFYGFSREIVSVRHALSILGIKEIESQIIAYGVLKIVKNPRVEGFQLNVFWTDSLMRALFSRELAKIKKISADEAFLGALLQDIALPILLTEWFDVYKRVYEIWQKTGERLTDVEERELSWHHAHAGAWIAKNWKLPDILTCGIGLHASSGEEIKRLGLENTPVATIILSSEVPSIYSRRCSCESLLLKAQHLDTSYKELVKAAQKAEELFLDTASTLGLSVRNPIELSELLENYLNNS